VPKPKAKYVQKACSRQEPKQEPKQEPVWVPPSPSSFVSGSAEKSEFDDYKRWKEEYDQSEPVKAKKRKEQTEEARKVIVNALDGTPREQPVKKEKQDEEEE